MSTQTNVIHELVRSFNERAQIDVARYFAPEFELDQAGAGPSRSGLAGARDMINALYGLGADVRIEILDMVEEGERVAVRWRITSDGHKGSLVPRCRCTASSTVASPRTGDSSCGLIGIVDRCGASGGAVANRSCPLRRCS